MMSADETQVSTGKLPHGARDEPSGASRMRSNPILSIVIPVFQESMSLAKVLAKVREFASATGESYELIVVDDGSSDETWRVIEDETARYPELRALRLSRNFGKEAAVSAGLDVTRGQAIVVMDGDLQHPPELLPRMVAIWKAGGVDLVEAVKEARPTEPLINRLGSQLFYSILTAFAHRDLKYASDFKLLDRRVVDAWRDMGERNLFFRGMVAWLGFKRAQVRFTVPDRVGGRSGWTLLKLVKLAVTAVTAFSVAPLQLVTFVGTIYFLFAVAIGIQTLYNWFSGIAVSGFTTVILLLLIISGVQMVCLGIFGAYIARIYDEVKGRPRYVVRDRFE